jgi:hypothetical protein
MSEFPKMLYRDGATMLHEGRWLDWTLAQDAQHESRLLSEGWDLGGEPARAATAAPKPAFAKFDRNGDGVPGGSLPASERGLDELKSEAESLGITIDRRWGEKRLRAEIAAAKAD